jgi:telomerase reverse transcriptase
MCLKYEQERDGEMFGCGVYGIDGVFEKVLSFVERLDKLDKLDKPDKTDRTIKQPLYWCSVDIKHCYDTINQTKLYSLINDILKQEQYAIKRYSICHPFNSRGTIYTKHVNSVTVPSEIEDFSAVAEKLGKEYSESVFSDGVKVSVNKKTAILDLIKEHIFNHIVVASSENSGNCFFLQNEGIAQGSVLSSLLCNVYYGDVEREMLGSIFGKGDEKDDGEYPRMLVRVVDDFLCVTTKREECESFLKVMTKGNEAMGVKINTAKTKTNMKIEGFEENYIKDGILPWCGMLFDTKTFETRIDYSDRFSGTKATDALTVEVSKNPGVNLNIKMKTFVRPRCSPILVDDRVNRVHTVELNVYQLFLLAAIKTRGYVVDMPGGIEQNPKFLQECITDLLDYVYALLCKRITAVGGVFCLSRRLVFCMGYHAFNAVGIGERLKAMLTAKTGEVKKEAVLGLKGVDLDSVGKEARKLFGFDEFVLSNKR